MTGRALSIYETAERLDDRGGHVFDFLCECGAEDRRAMVCMTVIEFRRRAEN
jgi:hypothetical protein